MDGVDSELAAGLVALRRELHRHPELSEREARTADRICRELDRLGISYRRGVAGHGIVADLPGKGSGPAVALRADMDALPITEETGLPFASQHEGVMHACAHDGHMSMLVGAAELLATGEPLPAPVRLVFQPAEEIATGARGMIAAGVLENVGMIFGGHIDRHYPTGTIAVGNGVVNASTDTFRIHVRGTGGHAARPHETVDAVVVGSLMVMALQTIVSREVNPAHPSVVTVGRFEAGTAENVIAARAVLEGTIRAQEPFVREHLKRSVRRIAESVGQLHGADVSVELLEGTAAVINHPDCATLARRAAADVVSQVVAPTIANMGGEDFSAFLLERPGCYVRFGAQCPGRESYPAHSSRFDFDEEVLALGAAYFAAVARRAAQCLATRAPHALSSTETRLGEP